MFFLFWDIHNFPPLENGEAVLGLATELFYQAYRAHLDFGPYMIQRWSQMALGPNLPMHTAYLIPDLYPLQTLWLGAAFWLFGANAFAIHFSAAVLSLAFLAVLYKTVARISGTQSALLATLFASQSLVLLLLGRTVFTPTVFGALFGALTLGAFFRGYSQKRPVYFLWGGLAYGFALLNCYPSVFVFPLILLVWLVWDSGSLTFLKGKYLWLGALLALGVFVLGSILFSAALTPNPWGNLIQTYAYYLDRGTDENPVAKGAAFLWNNPLMSLRVLFWSMPPYPAPFGTDMPNFTLVGATQLQRVLLPFFLLGLGRAFVRRSSADKLWFTWFWVSWTVFAFLITYEIRYFVVVLPALYALCVEGMLLAAGWLEQKWTALGRGRGLWLLAGLVFGISSLMTYKNYYVDYRQDDANLWGAIHSEVLAQEVLKAGPPEQVLVVLGHSTLIPNAPLFFLTHGEYRVHSWAGLLGAKEYQLSEMRLWEQEQFDRGVQKILYLFSLDQAGAKIPGKPANYGNDYDDLLRFAQLHPKLEPVRINYTSRGIPLQAVYVVNASLTQESTWIPLGTEPLVQTFRFPFPALEAVELELRQDGLATGNVTAEVLALDPANPMGGATQVLGKASVNPSGKVRLEFSGLKMDPRGFYGLALQAKGEGVFVKQSPCRCSQGSQAYQSARPGSGTAPALLEETYDWRLVPASTVWVPTPKAQILDLAANGASEEVKLLVSQAQLESGGAEGLGLFVAGDWSWFAPNSPNPASLTFELRGQKEMKTLAFTSFPRVHNDPEMVNFIGISISTNGTQFRSMGRLASDGRGIWTGIYERELSGQTAVTGKRLWVRFDFSGENSQLWAVKTNPLTLKVDFVQP
ncbi:MAG: hypothetical protein A2600_07885 [Candidatus Lambdaproteobacteria bacterium RIFOXYD1_FULL_56_27]|uniref:Glycosyltransferase RgtA/B/C/D-like domain-containing protein n=1 Tax=Candidatus Lambdaproteobacteria bacterium RIFOXYD2_FULL_56_26 TaxID=1817773 RepID=A0A1F6GNV0_9PROT|nr:MAG: hypothetical protein A2557_06105 [Candidatus Lambdaproteobacteria bacterium RIFOXYD2_FULL_56_26]OGG99878.1 MAG: hypothetical protein A2426_09840 [Candidatus Lambdaproteobacteria bacterium RIFOXYC1_FULL_56_13]OGH09693.1 MAG: hypothetical protein A2600_07885 [Candidatus Lambdaproteobacteria bacterium RIFOXYD1_FULL_56_27]